MIWFEDEMQVRIGEDKLVVNLFSEYIWRSFKKNTIDRRLAGINC